MGSATFHREVPTEPGDYWCCSITGRKVWLYIEDGTMFNGDSERENEREIAWFYGPLPTEMSDQIDTLCKVAFAEMFLAALNTPDAFRSWQDEYYFMSGRFENGERSAAWLESEKELTERMKGGSDGK